ncbi:hypothetical protein HHI36_021636 [Cryptolaemus montrouzieri]|uniref:Uncharacterized protein n=1 Tax=Cryptolaemus montrouzieri TaxID=559131 RepID=A0ABD2MXI0_9CUCU
MGRTKRIRTRRKTTQIIGESTDDINVLMHWMRSNNWKNTSHIKCSFFHLTGRGIHSTKKIENGDILIKVPYSLLITYSTLTESDEFMRIFKHSYKFKIQDMLAIFLIIENHKGSKSFWKDYIQSLPIIPPKLPWFSKMEEIEYFPKELKEMCVICKSNFKKVG